MTTVTFDMLNLVDKLKTAGFDQKQSESVIREIVEAQDGLVTKHDLNEVKNEIKSDINIRFERVDGELKLSRWMLGAILASVLSIVVKSFL